MCHKCVTKKFGPKVRFWEVTNLRLEPADLVNEHVLPKVKGSFPISLDEQVTLGLSLDDQGFLVQAKEPQESVARCFLGLKVGQGRGSAGGSAKVFRVASWRCWQALDHALFAVIVFVKPL